MDGDKIRIGIVYDNITEWSEYDMDLNGNTLTLIQDSNTVTLGAVVQSLTINVGETLKFSWTGKNGAPLTYSSSANMLASVSDDGVMKALSSGVVYITEHFCEFSEVLHTYGHNWLIEEIDEMINKRKHMQRN